MQMMSWFEQSMSDKSCVGGWIRIPSHIGQVVDATGYLYILNFDHQEILKLPSSVKSRDCGAGII